MAKKNPGTGKPDPRKDRSAHDAARGQKMQSLKDLIHQAPFGDIDPFLSALEKESDRSAAIMAAAYLERALYVMVTCSIADWGEARRNEWFEGPNAPFRSFSAKIVLGQAIFIYGKVTADRLNIIRNIRNAFAHASSPIDFDTPAIAREVTALFKGYTKPHSSHRKRFCDVCVWYALKFAQDAIEQGGKERETRFA